MPNGVILEGAPEAVEMPFLRLEVVQRCCVFYSFLAPKDSDPGPILTAVMGILSVRRALIVTPQSHFSTGAASGEPGP